MMIFVALIALSAIISMLWLARIVWVYWAQRRRIDRFCASLEQTHPLVHPGEKA